jgi:hypothetical protein
MRVRSPGSGNLADEAAMEIPYGGKLYGYKLVQREKIQPARDLPPVMTEKDKEKVASAAKSVIAVHREVLIALKDR